jgi:hypothetical protein
MKAAAIFAALVLLALAPSAVAQEACQYAVVSFPSLPQAQQMGCLTPLIVDTKNGYVWEWFSGTGVGRCATCTNLLYQGQAIPEKIAAHQARKLRIGNEGSNQPGAGASDMPRATGLHAKPRAGSGTVSVGVIECDGGGEAPAAEAIKWLRVKRDEPKPVAVKPQRKRKG